MEKIERTGMRLESISAHNPGKRARELVDAAATIIIKGMDGVAGKNLSEFEIQRRAVNALENAGVFKTLGVSREILFPEVQIPSEEALLREESKN